MSDSAPIAALRRCAPAFLPLMRRTGLAPLAEWALRQTAVAQARRENAAFCAAHPDLALPPADLLFETQSYAQLARYMETGRAAASALVMRLAPLLSEPESEVLDWGAGAARVLRFLPQLAPHWRVMGAEPNARAAGWAARHLPHLSILHTRRRPPLPFAADRFAAIYSISVLTHIPIARQRAWVVELGRILKPGGVLALTLHGAAAQRGLAETEKARLAAGDAVDRAGAAEGSRLFAAFHSAGFIRERLLEGFEILLHEENSSLANGGQDLWLCRRRP